MFRSLEIRIRNKHDDLLLIDRFGYFDFEITFLILHKINENGIDHVYSGLQEMKFATKLNGYEYIEIIKENG
jgi:hypothetical protein